MLNYTGSLTSLVVISNNNFLYQIKDLLLFSNLKEFNFIFIFYFKKLPTLITHFSFENVIQNNSKIELMSNLKIN